MIVSIIVPVYKGNKYVNGLIQMAENNQKYANSEGINVEIELILVNDYPVIAIDYEVDSTDIKIKIIDNSKNEGIHKSRVNGLIQSRGDYVLFLDQDDLITDNCITSQLKAIGDCDLLIANGYKVSGGQKKAIYRSKRKQALTTKVKAYLYAANQIVSPGHCLILKSAIPEEWKEYIIKINGGDDLFLWLLMFAYKKKIGINPDMLYTHVDTGINISGSKKAMIDSADNVIALAKKCPIIPKKWTCLYERRIRFTDNLVGDNRNKKIVSCIKNIDICIYKLYAYYR